MPTPQSQSNSLIVSVGVHCNVGKERTENQDRITRAATPFGDLFVVADGVGGHQGGAEAAQAVVDGFSRYLKANGNLTLPEALQQAVRAISSDLQQRSAVNQALRGMGSTVVLCVVNGDHATYAHAGDSRAYLVRDGKLSQLTRDHSVMERLVSQGVLTPAQAKDHPDASVLTRAIGQSEDVVLDIADIALQANDALLLCSDGLWGYASHEEMEAVATSASLSASGIATALLNLALEGGGGDNISIQFLRFEAAKARSRNVSSRKRNISAVTGLAAALAVGSAIMFVSNQRHKINPKVTATAPVIVPVPAKKPEAQTAPGTKETATASSSKQHTSAPEKASQPSVKVIVIQQKDGDDATAPWIDQVKQLSYLDVPESQSGSSECLGLTLAEATLFYAPGKKAVADKIKKDVPSAVLHELAPEKLNVCAAGEMVLLPAKSKLERATGELQKGGTVVVKKAKDAGKEIQKLGTEIGNEVNKRAPK